LWLEGYVAGPEAVERAVRYELRGFDMLSIEWITKRLGWLLETDKGLSREEARRVAEHDWREHKADNPETDFEVEE
jgi:hypothetical protein